MYLHLSTDDFLQTVPSSKKSKCPDQITSRLRLIDGHWARRHVTFIAIALQRCGRESPAKAGRRPTHPDDDFLQIRQIFAGPWILRAGSTSLPLRNRHNFLMNLCRPRRRRNTQIEYPCAPDKPTSRLVVGRDDLKSTYAGSIAKIEKTEMSSLE